MSNRYVKSDIIDRFTKKKDYLKFLGKKVRDLTPDEKRIYNRIAQQEKRNPFGKELPISAEPQFIPVGVSAPFQTDVPIVPQPPPQPTTAEVIRSEVRRHLLKSRRKKKLPPPNTDPIPTIADMRALLRNAGALDRTPPQQQHTPALNITNEDQVVGGASVVDVSNRRDERVIADTFRRLALDVNEKNRLLRKAQEKERRLDSKLAQLTFNPELRKKALIDALGVIGEKKRAEVGRRKFTEVFLQGATAEQSREAVEREIKRFDRDTLSDFKDARDTRQREIDNLMDGDVGDLKRAFDRFNIPSEFLLAPTRKLSKKQQKELLKEYGERDDWYARGLPIPTSPRDKRLDLQFGTEDPDDEFDPDPVASPLSSDDEWMREYLREDVREALARDRMRETGIDPRKQPREENPFKIDINDESLTIDPVWEDGTSVIEPEVERALEDIVGQLEEPQVEDIGAEALPLQEDLPISLSQEDVDVPFRPTDITEREIVVPEGERPTIQQRQFTLADNPFKEGTREAQRWEARLLSGNLRFPPNVYTAERGRVEFGFDPQPQTLPQTLSGVSEFALEGEPNLPAWALGNVSNLREPTYYPPSSDSWADAYAEAPNLFERSLLQERTGADRKEDEVRAIAPVLIGGGRDLSSKAERDKLSREIEGEFFTNPKEDETRPIEFIGEEDVGAVPVINLRQRPKKSEGRAGFEELDPKDIPKTIDFRVPKPEVKKSLGSAISGGSTGAGIKPSFKPRAGGRRGAGKTRIIAQREREQRALQEQQARATAERLRRIQEDDVGFAGIGSIEGTAEARERAQLSRLGVGEATFTSLKDEE